MATPEELEKELIAADEAVTKQGDTVRSLKASLKDGNAEKVPMPGAVRAPRPVPRR